MSVINDYDYLSPDIHRIGQHLRKTLRDLYRVVLTRKVMREQAEMDEAKVRADQALAELRAAQEATNREIEEQRRADQNFHHYNPKCAPCNRFGYPIR